MYIFHAHDEYINTLSNKSPVSAEYLVEISKNNSKKEENNLKRRFLNFIETKVYLPWRDIKNTTH
jgi:hypothetical protein